MGFLWVLQLTSLSREVERVVQRLSVAVSASKVEKVCGRDRAAETKEES